MLDRHIGHRVGARAVRLTHCRTPRLSMVVLVVDDCDVVVSEDELVVNPATARAAATRMPAQMIQGPQRRRRRLVATNSALRQR